MEGHLGSKIFVNHVVVTELPHGSPKILICLVERTVRRDVVAKLAQFTLAAEIRFERGMTHGAECAGVDRSNLKC